MMMASPNDEILCGICKEQERTTHADKWCPECDEGLCFGCEKHHRISKASRHHAVISINDYKGLPAEISKIYHHCQVHEKKFQNYCPHHEQPCCPVCIAKIHHTCTGLLDIADVVKNAKTSTLLESIEQSLDDSYKNIEIIISDREQNLSKIKEQRKQLHDKIKQKRDQINSHLDNLERKLIQEVDSAQKQITSQMEQLLGQLKEKSKAIKQIQHNLVEIKTHASDLQTFLGSKQLEKQADHEDKYIRSLVQDERLQTIGMNCTINEKLEDITAITAFGFVNIEKGPALVSLRTERDRQAQVMSNVRTYPGSIDDIKLTLVQSFNIPKGRKKTTVTGCTFFQNGKIVFTDCDYNQRILITTVNGVLQNEYSVSPYRPFAVTCLDNDLFAFTSSYQNIRIINTKSQTTTETIETTNRCYGITNKQGTLIYCEDGKGIIQLQLDTKSSKTIVRCNIEWGTYMTSNETNIYRTDYYSETVTCYNLIGDKIWEFKDRSVLQYPFGIAVDRHSNVYVASNKNNSIVVISSDGLQNRQILSSKDGIKDPWALAIDKEEERLLVTNFNGEVRLFEISSV